MFVTVVFVTSDKHNNRDTVGEEEDFHCFSGVAFWSEMSLYLRV